jgi:outer membrane protein assembly factor BamA
MNPVQSPKRLSELSGLWILIIALLLALFRQSAQAQTNVTSAPEATNAPSKFRSPEDNWLDASKFLDQKYGFLPVAFPITEPAVGYGGIGALAFLDKPLGSALAGYGRPDITAVGGFGTENGTWGAVAMNLHHWLDDRLQTQVALVYASVNLDFYGIGEDSQLQSQPLRYNLDPRGGFVQAKYRLWGSRFWVGLRYAIFSTEVSFNAPPGTPGLPSFARVSNVGGLTPSLTYDSRDNIFTPTRGSYVEVNAGLYSEALGGNTDFQRPSLVAIQYLPFGQKWTLGVRGDVAASYGDVPFYLRPYINLRGAPAMRYQGDEVAQIETEIRWQFWKRFSLVGFVGGGAAWNDGAQFQNQEAIVTGGTGFRYELAKEYGIHAGVDVAFGPDTTAVYFQVGSAWGKP